MQQLYVGRSLYLLGLSAVNKRLTQSETKNKKQKTKKKKKNKTKGKEKKKAKAFHLESYIQRIRNAHSPDKNEEFRIKG
jgi:hypothetical protein